MFTARAIGTAILLLLWGAAGCGGPTTEQRAREVAAEIQASIRDYDGPALEQKVTTEVVTEVQTHLTTLKEYMGEINGEIDPVLVNAIQAFQRNRNEQIPWWRFWQRSPNDGLITEDLRRELAAAAAATA